MRLADGPFLLAKDRNQESQAKLDEEVTRKYLGYSIHGQSVIETLKTEKPEFPVHMGGTDVSVQPIGLSEVLPWSTRGADAQILTAVGVRYDMYRRVQDIERYPDPKMLAQYERRQAIEEGLLIPPPGTITFPWDMESKVREAAMDLRQYKKDFELMFEKDPACTVHFRDGRILPLEHRMADAVHGGLHGEIVRYALKTFKNIVNVVGADEGRVLYCGYVKRPGVDIIAALVAWYMGFGSAQEGSKSIDPEMTLEQLLTYPEGDDQVIAELFLALKDTLGQGEFLTTFRLLRRFPSLEEDYIRYFPPSTNRKEWENRLSSYRQMLDGLPDDTTGIDLIATLCARAAVLSFYTSLTNLDSPGYSSVLSIPRLEILIPYPELEMMLEGKGHALRELDYVRRLLSLLQHPGALDRYPDALFFQQESPRVFLAPRTICEAHTAAKGIALVYKDDILNLLVKEAKILWNSRER